MADYLCHGCGRKTNSAYQCRSCKKILCSSCKTSSTCRDNAKGKAGCSGSYDKLS